MQLPIFNSSLYLYSVVKLIMEPQLKRSVFRYYARVIDQHFQFLFFLFQVRSRLYVGKLNFHTVSLEYDFFFFSFVILLLIIQVLQHLTAFPFLGREKQLANKIAELLEDKCKILEKLSLCKKEVMVLIYCLLMCHRNGLNLSSI